MKQALHTLVMGLNFVHAMGAGTCPSVPCGGPRVNCTFPCTSASVVFLRRAAAKEPLSPSVLAVVVLILLPGKMSFFPSWLPQV